MHGSERWQQRDEQNDAHRIDASVARLLPERMELEPPRDIIFLVSELAKAYEIVWRPRDPQNGDESNDMHPDVYRHMLLLR